MAATKTTRKKTVGTGSGAGVGSGVLSAANHDDHIYVDYVRKLSERLAQAAAEGPLFHVATDVDLAEVYLSGFLTHQQQYYTCHACRAFLERYGNLARVTGDGDLVSALFTVVDAPEVYRLSAASVVSAIAGGRIDRVFCEEATILGTPATLTGPTSKQPGVTWHHLYAQNPRPWRDRLHTGFQHAAEKQQDFEQVSRALGEFSRESIEQVGDLLQTDAVYRAEKVLGPAKFLADLHAVIARLRGERRRNVIYHWVAAAPAGFCHPRSSMVGTLLDDLATGMAFDTAAARFKAKMHPLSYQRPQAPPRAGQIDAAERLVEMLGIGPSLRRRWATVDDVQEWLWRPPMVRTSTVGGMFDHLRQSRLVVPPVASTREQQVTWRTFSAQLADVVRVEVRAPLTANYYGLLAAAVPDSPPIFQWDREDRRNTVSWYVYHGGSTPQQWGLTSGWRDAVGVALPPWAWGGGTSAHFDKQAMFVLGGYDRRSNGNAIFPETLRGDLREIRSTIEAHSKRTPVERPVDGNACGLMYSPNAPVTVRVTRRSGVVQTVVIGLWE